jgi:prephenate dehydrogenase
MRALIAGLGLIGGSIGMALRARGWRVAFLDPNVSVDEARRAGAADEEGGDADVIVIATPVDVAIDILPALQAPVVTSVCSVMAPLRAVAGENFVAGHPLAGSHERGLAAARADLFEARRWFVDREHATVDKLIADCGANRELVEARTHDDALALTSHLPQILSTALAAYAERSGVDPTFAGNGLRTFLRLAASDASVWTPVLAENRAAIERHLEQVIEIARELAPEHFADAQHFVARLGSE